VSRASSDAAPCRPSGLLAVLVLFERDLSQALPWPWLQDHLREPHSAPLQLQHVLIYDNSPMARVQPEALGAQCSYLHDPTNGGTAAAYQHAVGIAESLGLGWLLLLDQDSSLPSDYLQAAAHQVQADGATLSCLVPWVADQGRPVSPAVVRPWGTIRPLRRSGTARVGHLAAVASGCLVRVAALRGILPFPRALWLDYVDHWMFAQLQGRGERVSVLDQRLEHHLSVLAPAQLSPRRLRSILDGERYFVRTQGVLARLVYPLRLMARVVRYALVSPPLAAAALGWIAGRGRLEC